jgi:hypothetical protein
MDAVGIIAKARLNGKPHKPSETVMLFGEMTFSNVLHCLWMKASVTKMASKFDSIPTRIKSETGPSLTSTIQRAPSRSPSPNLDSPL